jgi:hypothetical protein
VGRPLWREDGSVFGMCRWSLPAQSFSGLSPLGLATVFYCLRFETSLFVASYDSQGHGGGIGPRLHTDDLLCVPFGLLYSTVGRTRRRLLERVFVAAGTAVVLAVIPVVTSASVRVVAFTCLKLPPGQRGIHCSLLYGKYSYWVVV